MKDEGEYVIFAVEWKWKERIGVGWRKRNMGERRGEDGGLVCKVRGVGSVGASGVWPTNMSFGLSGRSGAGCK